MEKMECNQCKQTVVDGAKCNLCHGYLHYGCAGIAEVSYRKLGAEKKAAWRCIQCRNPGSSKSSTTESSQQAIAIVLEEIKAMRVEFSSIKTDIHSTSLGIQNLNTKWSEVESRFSDLEDRLVNVENKMASLTKLQSDLKTANETISHLQDVNNSRDQYSRINNVEISGVPVTSGENLHSILNSICSKVGIQLDPNDIDSIHRVRRFRNGNMIDGSGSDGQQARGSAARAPAIVVRFARRLRKDELLAAVRARRGLSTADLGLAGPAANLYVADHLTPANKLLLKRARQLKMELNYSYLWVRDCKIFMRKNDKSKVCLVSKDSDLTKLK